MKLDPIKPSKSLNKAYYKQSLSREQIELFKKELQNTFNHIDEKQDEEYHKNVIADLFKNVYCKDKYLVNVNKKEDLVIRLGNNTTDDVGVLLEFKKPTEKRDMVSIGNANVKALQESILYYLRQTVDNNNHKITNVVVTNIYEWFIFDGVWFEKNIFRNTKLKKDYLAFKTSGHDTKYFYEKIAAKHLADFIEKVPCTYFNLLDYKKIINDNDPKNDNDLIDLYKILSPEHLLNKNFANDSNSLNTDFYNELLYIIGLEESKETAKKTIRRINEADRNEGSLIENTIAKLKTKKHFGYEINDEIEFQYYEVALELCITWLNRILFLKLLESQLIKYHRGDKENYSFLSYSKIKDFDELEELFFEVLAEKVEVRKPDILKKYLDIPYLNSSLFEMTDLEKNALSLSNLKDRLEFPVYKKSVLKKATKDEIKPKTSLNYLLDFLDAYNFASESNAKIQEENKSIINASVLGLIFEKINGYKDGSFFTPGFITMYMCRETIRKAVVEKFKTSFANCQDITQYEELKEKIDYTNKAQRQEANKLINEIKIVDPAVGSGHFLVSALNEMIAIKSDLQILSYANGNRVLGYSITLDNDELIIQNQETDKLFEYTLNQNNNIIPDLQDLQECLFNEKQTIIENCLFGVDINPKSVMICQLRLWIELLKNAYYNPIRVLNSDRVELQLQTLPNIDINIKTGNSLISKFAIKDNVFERIAGFQDKLQEYKTWVSIYKSTNDKGAKDVLKKKIKAFKDEFVLVDVRISKLQNDLRKLNGNYYDKYQTHKMFASELSSDELVWKQKLEAEIAAKQVEIQAVKDNPIYENAFEWRFEFPEVLDDNGDFVGFDVVIGNPPYVDIRNIDINSKFVFNIDFKEQKNSFDLYTLFIQRGFQINSLNGYVNFILPKPLFYNSTFVPIRKILFSYQIIEFISHDDLIFDDANVETCIINIKNSKTTLDFILKNNLNIYNQSYNDSYIEGKPIIFTNNKSINLLEKFEKLDKISKYCEIIRGLEFGKNSFSRKINSDETFSYFAGEAINKYTFDNSKLFYLLKSETKLLHKKSSKFEQYPRILIRRVAQEPIVTILNSGESIINNLNSVYNLTLKEKSKFNESSICGILNSKLIKFFFKNTFSSGEKIFPYLRIEQIKEIPLPNNISKQLAVYVDQILTIKKADPKADTNALETQIDQLVYQLYDLTPDEIAIVEG